MTKIGIHLPRVAIWLRSGFFQFAIVTSVMLCHGVMAEDVVKATLVAPTGVLPLPDGRLLISDIESHRIFQLDPSGQLSFWGGNGEMSFSGDGGPVSQASFNAPNDLKLDVANSAVLIADSNNHRIRRVDLRTLTVTTLAGNGVASLRGDLGPARECSLNNPQGLDVDRLGNVLIADTFNHVVRRIGHDGIITTVAGSTAGQSGDGGPALSAQLSLPMAVAFDVDNRGFVVSDFGNSRLRRVFPDGTIETVCGMGKGSDDAGAGFSGDGESAKKAKIFSPLDLVVASPNCLYFSDSGNHRIRSVLHGIVITVAGTGDSSNASPLSHVGNASESVDIKTAPGSTNDSGQQSVHPLKVPAKMAVAPDGGLYFCDRGNRAVRLLQKDGTIKTLVSGRVTSHTDSER